jgi:hypothetical protein
LVIAWYNNKNIRIRIFELSVQEQLQSGPLVGQIEVDESYFGARRVKGNRGRGARGKEKGVKHAKIYAIDLRTKIPCLPTEQTRI